MSILPASNVINVSITNTPSGLTEKNVNSLALFTQDAPINNEVYGVYISATQVAENYGTNSKTALMANAIFSQVPNLRSGNGRLVIIPMLAAVSATQGQFVTADISANLAAIIAVGNGDIKITIDGAVAQNLEGLDFTNCITWADVAAVIQAKLLNGVVTATANGFKIQSKAVGTASTVAMVAVAGGPGTNMAVVGLFNAAGGTPTAGANSSGESILDCIARTSGLVGYVPIISSLDIENTKVKTIADGIQALGDYMFLQHSASTYALVAGGLGHLIADAGDTRTRILCYTASLADANLMKAAYAGRGFSVNFNGSNTSQTLNLKQLVTIEPDIGISQTDLDNAESAGVDLYVSYDGMPSVVSTGGNDYFDDPYGDLALKFALITAGFNYLRQTNTKVPQTEPGMNGLKSAYAGVCGRFVNNGCIAPGKWNSSETFGDPVIFNNNVLSYGYYVFSQPISHQDPAEREQRKAPLVQIAIKRAGAIQSSDVTVIVNN